jgi:DAACS family dicarboxylate/amino acid:cation (Na+ or H+) symporter
VLTLASIVRLSIGMPASSFFSRTREALITAFSTSSSSAALPTALAATELNLGIPPQIAGFVLPLGSTMCMNGTALFQAVAVVTLAQAFGISLGAGALFALMAVCVVTAVGAAGVPGGSIPLLIGALRLFDVPVEGIALIIGVDRLLDMARTTVNVASALAATAFVARSEGGWSPSMLPRATQADTQPALEAPTDG